MKSLIFYIDPGSSSMLLQFIIGAFLAVVFFFKNIMLRIKSFFRRDKENSNPESGM